MSLNPEIQTFCDEFRSSVATGAFAKLTLSKARRRDGLQKMVLSPVTIQGVARIKVVESLPTQDRTQVLDLADSIEKLTAILGGELVNGHLLTTNGDIAVLSNRRGKMKIVRSAASQTSIESTSHNRQKNHQVDRSRPFLRRLGIADQEGRIKPTMAAKYKQIQRFVELLNGLVDEAELDERSEVRIVDIGSGKGYLTFALYDFLKNVRRLPVAVEGIEHRRDLVEFCNRSAEELDFNDLQFRAARAASVDVERLNVVIALHACNTATDDAIHLGVARQAELIVCSPCCQHELASQLNPNSAGLSGLHQFGLFKQRQADLVTDTARALLLEAVGYRVKVIEFVASEHTNKNVMLAAVKNRRFDRDRAWLQYVELKRLFGFQSFTLENQLKPSLPGIVND